jgi:hypothetical protein
MERFGLRNDQWEPAQFNLGMARMILASDAAVTRRIRLPMDALSRGAWGG